MVLLSRLPILRTQAFSLRITNGLEYNGCFGEVMIYLVRGLLGTLQSLY